MAEALRLAVPLILRFVPGAAIPEPSLPGARGEAARPGAGGAAAPGAGPNEWERDARAGVAGAAAGGRPAHLGALGRGTAPEPGAKVSWDKFRGGERSCCCPGAEGGEGSRHRPVSNPWERDFLSQGSYTLFSRTCDSSRWRVRGFLCLSSMETDLGGTRVRSQCRLLRECLCGLVARTLRAYPALCVFEPQYPPWEKWAHRARAGSLCVFGSTKCWLDPITIKALSGRSFSDSRVM